MRKIEVGARQSQDCIPRVCGVTLATVFRSGAADSSRSFSLLLGGGLALCCMRAYPRYLGERVVWTQRAGGTGIRRLPPQAEHLSFVVVATHYPRNDASPPLLRTGRFGRRSASARISLMFLMYAARELPVVTP